MADYGVKGSISGGTISRLKVTRKNVTSNEEIASFSVDSKVATVTRIRTDKPSYLLKAISEVYSTEYVEEVVLFNEENDELVIPERDVNTLENEQ